MRIKIPHTARRKALLLIDVQPGTLSAGVMPLVEQICSFVDATEYDGYVQVSYHAGENSMLARQGHFTISKEKAGGVAPDLKKRVAEKSRPVLEVEKDVRSCFKGFHKNALQNFLEERSIAEVHLVGYDINDCVLASAYDAIDQGYFTYVIEELCHHWDGLEELKEAAIKILRRQSMTNNSSKEASSIISF